MFGLVDQGFINFNINLKFLHCSFVSSTFFLFMHAQGLMNEDEHSFITYRRFQCINFLLRMWGCRKLRYIYVYHYIIVTKFMFGAHICLYCNVWQLCNNNILIYINTSTPYKVCPLVQSVTWLWLLRSRNWWCQGKRFALLLHYYFLISPLRIHY